ncbi:hypothetical protein SAMN05216199_3009 [Pedococcus cremeus]|uniref:Gram-positive cocci surface proteins LPxTG domain-containing protein n=1 Tax=Pedococcus cremeus TaxID=587636 RepID=A0A1H9WLI5_9MICO|nr:hypothetical protein [Pedococcus cremeus]SES34725.1 hypothetical protein SAMN05216199_3009 [Pedococcus cremeus]
MTRTNASHHSFSARPGASFRAATRPLGRAALSCGLAGALSLGAAGAALAGGHDSAAQAGGGQGRAAGQQSSAQKSSAQQSSAQKSASQKSSSQKSSVTPRTSENHGPAAATKDSGSRQPAEATNTGSQRAARAHQQKSSGSRTSTPQRDHDPRGNNGTIKIDGPAWDARVDNEPHTSCAFRVTFFGFDEGQTADITVTGVAPTGGGVLLHETAVPTSGDPAGGAAHDFDGATRVYTADDLGLDVVTPHPQQGYHLKVAVDTLEAPGGAKQKVLWLEPCGTESPVTQPEVGGLEQGTETPPSVVPGSQPETPAGSEAPAGSETSEVAATSELPQGTAVTAPRALRAEAAYREAPVAPVTQGSAHSAIPQAQQASALPASLAFTGAAGLELLALTGAAAAAAGAGLLVARRRASAQAG